MINDMHECLSVLFFEYCLMKLIGRCKSVFEDMYVYGYDY